jgi:hypothetical protein
MRANLNKPHLWKEDIARSVDLYNEWFLNFAPNTYREERVKATKHVQDMLHRTNSVAILLFFSHSAWPLLPPLPVTVWLVLPESQNPS